MTPAEFIHGFLEGPNRPSVPDGRRLVDYGCDRREYRQLKALLREQGEPSHLRLQLDGYGQTIGETPDFESEDIYHLAAFVLFGAEWCGRYEPPPRRTWSRLLNDIRWGSQAYAELYWAIRTGLGWWGTHVIGMPGSTRYFDTLCYQGGLPIDGLFIMELDLVSETKHEATYQATDARGRRAGRIRLPKSSPEPASRRIMGTFNVGRG